MSRFAASTLAFVGMRLGKGSPSLTAPWVMLVNLMSAWLGASPNNELVVSSSMISVPELPKLAFGSSSLIHVSSVPV